MKKNPNLLDEMQEQTLLKIEHRGFQIAFWGLFAAIYFQKALGYDDFAFIGAESVILLVISLYSIFASLKNGIWDRHLHPTFKSNVCISLGFGFLLGLFWFLTSLRRYHHLLGSLATFAFMFILCSICTMALLSLLCVLLKRKKSQLDDQADFDEIEE